MTPDEFIKRVEELDEHGPEYYGMLPVPTNAQYGLHILIQHFLGESWYTPISMHQEQVNTEAIYEILRLYPNGEQRRERNRKRAADFFHNIIDSIFG